MNKQTIHFDMELFQGYTCIGCAVINDLAFEVEFTDDEIAQMKQLVSQLDETLYSEGIMPVLKEGAPELYDRTECTARNEIFDFLVSDGISQGYIEFDEDELHANFRKDFGIGDDEEIDENMYDDWYYEETSRINSEGLEWIRSRYSVDNQVCMEDYTPNYTVDIPIDFLP
jgi:hypothetical protein